MADAHSALTLAEVLTALGPIVGTGGLVSLGIAYLGYRNAAREGRPRGALDTPTTMGIGVVLADAAAVHEVGTGISRLAAVLERAVEHLARESGDLKDTLEAGTDEVRKLRRAIEDLPRKID